MDESEIIDIAPDGDVVFVCTAGDGHSVRIRVLSVFISTASPVFKTMLGPKFKEGSALATASSVDVPLPDDDPSSMILVFKAMHMRISSLPPTLDMEAVKHLAVVIDKYGCAEPLAPMTYYWIQGRLQKPDCALIELYDLLHVTHLLRQQELFGQIGIKLVLETTDPIAGRHDSLVHAYTALEKQRLVAAMSLMAFVQQRTQDTLWPTFDCMKFRCSFAPHFVANFMDILGSVGLWALDPHHLRLETVLLAMRQISFQEAYNGCPPHHEDCCVPDEDVSGNAAEAFDSHAAMTLRNLHPICMICFQEEKCSHDKTKGAFRTRGT